MVYDQAGFRKKVLNLDPAAIKAGLKSEVYTHGFADMYKLMKQKPGQSKYEISYPDGSKIGFVSSDGGAAKTPKAPVERQGDDYYGPSYGYGSDWGYYNFWNLNQSPGWFNGGYDYWYLSSSIGMTEVGINSVYYYTGNGTSQIISYNPWSTSSGVFSLAASTSYSYSPGNNTAPSAAVEIAVVNLSQTFSYVNWWNVDNIKTLLSPQYFMYCDFEAFGNGLLQGWAFLDAPPSGNWC
jgi:hypothetical protein